MHEKALIYTGLVNAKAGNVQGKIKKVIRDDNNELTEKARDAILDEAGDLLWYLARLFAELDTDYESVAEKNKQKLLDRRGRGALNGSGDNR